MELLLANGMRVSALPSLPVTPGTVATRMNQSGQAGTVPAELLQRLNDETLKALQQMTVKFSQGHGDTPPAEQLRQLGFPLEVLGDNPPAELVQAILDFVQSLMANPAGKVADANANADPSTVSAFNDTAGGRRAVRPDVIQRALQGSADGRAYLKKQAANATALATGKMSAAAGSNTPALSAVAIRTLSGTHQGRTALRQRGIRPVTVS